MIISHKNKFTLMRVPKTGSTSLEASVRFCGAVHKDDICSNTEDAFLPAQNIPDSIKKESAKTVALKRITDQKIKYKLDLTNQEKEVISQGKKWVMFLEHNTLNDWFDIPCCAEANLISKKQVHEYKHYGFLRNPIERYLSCFVFWQMWLGKHHAVTIEEFHKFTLNQLHKQHNVLFRPQKDYFYFKGKQIVEPLLFDNWSSEASRMIKEVGFNPLSVYPRFKENGGSKNKLKKKKPTVSEWVDSSDIIKNYLEEYFFEDIEFYKKHKK